MTEPLLSIEQALEALPVRKSRRWLIEFLHRTKTDPRGSSVQSGFRRDAVNNRVRL
jgi:hypothetical protein